MCQQAVVVPTVSNKQPKAALNLHHHQQEIQVGFVLLVAIYTSVYQTLTTLTWLTSHGYSTPVLRTAAAEYCNSNNDCHRPDLMAYKVTSLLGMMYMGCFGVYHWHFSPAVRELSDNRNDSVVLRWQQRLFGSSLEAAQRVNVAILCYQVWDLAVSLTIPEYARDTVFLVHHALAALCAGCSLHYQMVPYYAIYFGGCTELSSIFLVVADFDQVFPSTHGSTLVPFYDALILGSQALFVLTFSYYRVVGWWRVSYDLWSDAMHALSKQLRLPVEHVWFLYLFLALNVLLGCLQLYWFAQIVEKVVDMV